MDTTFDPKQITYIITVHGMGEQRDNETLTPVASRFVDVIQDFHGTDPNPYPRNTLSLGQATGQEEEHANQHYAAFEGLTMSRLLGGDPGFEFYGCERDPSIDPDAIRFADIYWQGILQDQWVKVGQKTDTWLGAVVSRFFQNEAHPFRLKTLLYTLEQTVDVLYYASKFKLKDLGTTIFEKFLGDVQVYTESSGCRSQAIAHFHDTMNLLQKNKGEGITNRYIIIAHSLGTIMSLDALIQANRDKCDWLDNVEGYITLGSPIDKIITLWDFNYKNLETDPGPDRTDHRIPHYNYCDEQDPVGYALNEIPQKKAYKNLFEKKEDIVYNHSMVPGMAHISYWNDIELFRHIIRKIVAPTSQKFDDSKMWFKKKVYSGVLGITYFLIPLFLSVLNVITLTVALDANSWQKQVISSLLFVTTMWFGKQILSLVISWRLSGNRGKMKEVYAIDEETKKMLLEKDWNKVSFLLYLGMALSIIVPAALFIWNPFGCKLTLTSSQLVPFLLTAFGSLVFLLLFFQKRKKEQAIIGKVSSNQLATVLTIVFSIILLTGSILQGNISVIKDNVFKGKTATSATSILTSLVISDAFAQPQFKETKPRQKPETTTVPRIVPQPVLTNTLPSEVRYIHDTIRIKERIHDTIREGATQDSSKAAVTIPATSQTPSMVYFSFLANAFFCFTYSTLKYVLQKGRIKRMRAKEEKRRNAKKEGQPLQTVPG